jgi:non-heme chloroperoxidase
LLFLHGFSGSLYSFEPVLAHLPTSIHGHSMGSAVALRMALDYPERVRALVLFDAGMLAPGGPKEQAFWETTISKLQDPISPALVRGFLETVYARPIPEERFERTLRNSLKVPAHVWRTVWKGRLEGRGMSGNLSEIGAPTLIIWGGQDIRCSRAEQDGLLAGIPMRASRSIRMWGPVPMPSYPSGSHPIVRRSP